MPDQKPPRPHGDTIDVADPEAVRAWALWLQMDQASLIRIVRIVGSSAGQVEYILGKNRVGRW